MQRTMRIPASNVDKETRKRVKDSCEQARLVANRAMTLCHVTSIEGVSLNESLYKQFPGEFDKAKGIVSTITQDAAKAYLKDAYSISKGNKSIRSWRSYPLPVKRSMTKIWQEAVGDSSRIAIECKLLSGSGEWEGTQFRLRYGTNYEIHLKTLRKIVPFVPTVMDKIAQLRDSKVWIDRRGNVVFGLSVNLPKKFRTLTGKIRVSTARDALLIATKSKSDVPFTINADHVKRWCAERRRRINRLMQDRKSGQKRAKVKGAMDDVAWKHRCRMKSFCQETATHVVKHAIRRGCGILEYDETIKSYIDEFPYFDLKTCIKNKCEAEGIQFVESLLPFVSVDSGDNFVYFQMAVDTKERKHLGKVKIGKTTKEEERKKCLEGNAGHGVVLLSADFQEKKNLHAQEKHYHSYFSHCRLPEPEGWKKKWEWFELEPVVGYLREVGCLGNTGNLSQIMQYLDL